VPVLLRPGRVRVHAEAAELGPLAQAALELGETGESGQAGHVVPEPDGVLRVGEPADDRAEESRAFRRTELDDRGADVPAGQCQRLVALGADLIVPPGVIHGAGQVGGQARLGEQGLDEAPAAADRGRQLGRARGIEDLAADGLVERADGVPAVLGPGAGRDPQQAQPGGVPFLVAGREVAVVVDPGVDHPQGDEPPVDGVVPLGRDHAHPLARDPGERAHRVEVETDVIAGHAVSPSGQAVAAGVCSRR